MNYYISDLHLNHKNVTDEGKNFDNRPFKTLAEMHETIKKNWNEKVANSDVVYVLGDMVWRPNEEMIAFVSQLKGHKVLVRGNHDDLSDYRYRQLFAEICDYKEITDNLHGINHNVVLSHFPIMMWNGQHRNWIHLYGHVHNSQDEEFYQDAVARLNELYKERDGEHYKQFYAYNVGCMLWNYTPMTLTEIMETKQNYIKRKGEKHV